MIPAGGDDDVDFEARLAALKRAKGETPYGEGIKKNAAPKEKAPAGEDERQTTCAALSPPTIFAVTDICDAT